MDEYETCMSDLRSPLGAGIAVVIFIIGAICTPIGFIGTLQSWGPPELYVAIFSLGIAGSFLTIGTLLYILIAGCCRAPVKRSNPLRALEVV
jgi:hypothetical protein